MELKELLKPEKKDIAALKQKTDEVNQLVQKMSTEMYQKAAAEQAKQKQSQGAGAQGSGGSGPQGAGSSAKKDEKVVDAEYKVEDEKKEKKK